MIQTHNLYIFTRTPLHVGAGSSVGAIDQPIQRERHSRHPIIPGSSIKGVLRSAASQLADMPQETVDLLFGPDDSAKEARAGAIAFGEARPLAFPVRSAKGSFAFVTCPLALKRYARDGRQAGLPGLVQLEDQTCLAGDKVSLPSKNVVLEEYCFEKKGEFPAEWEQVLTGLVDDPVWQELKGRLVLLSDGDFSHFVATTTEVSQHIKIDPKTGTVARGALFNLESVPAETLFSAPINITGRGGAGTDCGEELVRLIDGHPMLQFGGNSTTGRGFCTVSLGQ